MSNKEKNMRTVAVSEKTANKLERVKNFLGFEKGTKETGDSVIDYLLDLELKKIESKIIKNE